MKELIITVNNVILNNSQCLKECDEIKYSNTCFGVGSTLTQVLFLTIINTVYISFIYL